MDTDHLKPWERFLFFFIDTLSLYAVVLFFVSVFNKQWNSIIYKQELFISALFLIDWFYFLYRSPDKKNYIKVRFIDLLSAIPITENISGLRIFRLIRLINYIFDLNVVKSYFKKRPPSQELIINYIAYFIGVYFFCTTSIYDIEMNINPRMHNYGDALWLGFATITTIGYGDIYPVTFTGRMFCLILTIFGMGFYGLIVADLSNVLLKMNRRRK